LNTRCKVKIANDARLIRNALLLSGTAILTLATCWCVRTWSFFKPQQRKMTGLKRHVSFLRGFCSNYRHLTWTRSSHGTRQVHGSLFESTRALLREYKRFFKKSNGGTKRLSCSSNTSSCY